MALVLAGVLVVVLAALAKVLAAHHPNKLCNPPLATEVMTGVFHHSSKDVE